MTLYFFKGYFVPDIFKETLMYKVRHADRYLPCVFTRICDDEPQSRTDLLPRLIPLEKVKQEVRQNIELILNSRSRPSDEELENDREICSSVLGFGLTDFCGLSCSQSNVENIAKAIREQLVSFEPRLEASSIRVTCINQVEQNRIASNALALEITASYAIEALKDEFICISYLDLETGAVSVKAKDEA